MEKEYVQNQNDSQSGVTLRINEYQLHNEKTIRNSSWDTPDWIELYNYGDKDIWLGDKHLSDDHGNLQKCSLPNAVIEAGSYLIVYASSQTEEIEDEVHVSFKLSESDKGLYLTMDDDTIIDNCRIEEVPVDISAGINESGSWAFFSSPTPGSVNVGMGSKESNIEPAYEEILPVVINEYMSSNTYTILDSYCESSDWIELYNPNDTAINLNDYFISDNLADRGKHRLPNYNLEAHSYVLVYASGQNLVENEEVHVPFSLGKNDLNIVISDYTGNMADMCTVEVLPTDISAGRNYKDKWVYFSHPSPREENTKEGSEDLNIAPERVSTSPIVINEVMSNNRYGILDEDGDTSDWIELYNPSDNDMSLSGYALSDDGTVLDKWLFPEDAIIKADGYLVVFLSGKNKDDEGELHAGFSLSAEDGIILLVDANGAVASSMEIEEMPGNVSKGRTELGDYGYFTLPTPNRKNTGFYADELKNDEDIMLSDVYISEVSAGQTNYNRYIHNGFYEFIEMYNSGDENVNLSGYTIEDNSGEPWTFPNVIIRPNSYVTLQLKGYAKAVGSVIDVEDLSINASGERLVLKNADGVIIDCFDTGFLTSDISSGRVEGEGSARYFFAKKTPAKVNSDSVLDSYCTAPYFSHDGGMVDEESILLELFCNEGEKIRYTTNGDEPNEYSPIYTEPVLIDKDSIIRAEAFAEGKVDSVVVSRTYILEREHTLPIVCLSTNPAHLYSSTSGIFAKGPGYEEESPHLGANYWMDWECPINFEYYDEDNILGLNFEAGMQVAGQYSRQYTQKSIVVRLRDGYGLSEVYYPLFEDSEVNEFKHILLRTSGQDIGITKIKDYFIHESVRDYTDLELMEGKSAAVYINGQYWGLYNIREKQNEDYLASYYNIDADDVTIVKCISTLLTGDMYKWRELVSFLNENDFSDDYMFEELEKRIDVDAFMDYIIIESFCGNYDMGNIKYWKHDEDSKWRPMLFDTDLALSMTTYNMNYIETYLNPSEYSVVFNALFQNQGFKDDFVERYAYFLNEVFTDDKLISLINELSGKIDGEIKYQSERFSYPHSYEKWCENIEDLKWLVVVRRDLSVEHLQSVFMLSDEEIDDMFPWYNE